MTPEQEAAVASYFRTVLLAIDDVQGKLGLVAARATRMETRQARLLLHMGLTHDGRPAAPAPAPSYHAYPDSAVMPG